MNIIIAIIIVAGAAFVLGWKGCEWTVQRKLRALDAQLLENQAKLRAAIAANTPENVRTPPLKSGGGSGTSSRDLRR